MILLCNLILKSLFFLFLNDESNSRLIKIKLNKNWNKFSIMIFIHILKNKNSIYDLIFYQQKFSRVLKNNSRLLLQNHTALVA